MLNNPITKYFFLHVFIIIYSFSGVFAKYASLYNPVSIQFIFFYGLMIFTLFIYAIGWQKVLKYTPISTAYMNKSTTVIWGLIFGVVIFDEIVTLKKLVGITLILIGVVIYSYDKKSRIISNG